jgi:hypothetical protein
MGITKNLHDAMGYGIIAVVPLKTGIGKPNEVLIGYNGRSPIYKAEEDLGWYETSRSMGNGGAHSHRHNSGWWPTPEIVATVELGIEVRLVDDDKWAIMTIAGES